AWASPAPRRACCRREGRTAGCRGKRSRTWDSGVRSLTHQVAPFVLRAIEGLVGQRHEAVGSRNAVLGEGGEPDRDRQVERVLPGSAKSWCMTRRRNRSAKIAAPCSAVSGITTTNSSPP